MTFQQKAYAVYWIALAIAAVATLLSLLDDRRVSDLAYWLYFSSLPLFLIGIPALLNQHVFNKEQDSRGNDSERPHGRYDAKKPHGQRNISE